jgi:hypothetical protein
MTDTPIGDSWRRYRAEVVHPEAGDTQLHETEVAFYAGAATFLSVMAKSIKPDTENSLEGIRATMRVIETMKTEIDLFASRHAPHGGH